MTRKLKESYRVGISGSYGGLNLGDEAILQSIMTQLRRSLPVPVEFVILSRNPDDTLLRHVVAKALPVRDLTIEEIGPELEGLDLLILGGGGILFDSEARIYLREAAMARRIGVPVMVYAVSAGPLEQRGVQRQVAETLNQVNTITVRDRVSKKILQDAGVEREVIVTADPALLLEPEPLSEEALARERIGQDRQVVGMSVREPGVAAPDLEGYDYHTLLANAADYMIDRFEADVLFIPLERHVLDLQHSHAIISRMLRPQHARVCGEDYNSGQLLDLTSRLDFAVGMRLHFLIFAALGDVPFVALPYSAKVNAFLEELEMKGPPIKLVNTGRLIAHIDYYWDHREELREKIGQLLPSLRQRAAVNNRLAVGLITGEEPEINEQ